MIEQRDLQQMALRPVMFRELMLKQAISQALMNLQVQEGQAQKVPVRDVNAVFKMMRPVQELIQQQGIDARTMVVIDLRQEVGEYRVSVQNANNSVDEFDKQYQSANKTVQQLAFNESQQHYENSSGGYSQP